MQLMTLSKEDLKQLADALAYKQTALIDQTTKLHEEYQASEQTQDQADALWDQLKDISARINEAHALEIRVLVLLAEEENAAAAARKRAL